VRAKGVRARAGVRLRAAAARLDSLTPADVSGCGIDLERAFRSAPRPWMRPRSSESSRGSCSPEADAGSSANTFRAHASAFERPFADVDSASLY